MWLPVCPICAHCTKRSGHVRLSATDWRPHTCRNKECRVSTFVFAMRHAGDRPSGNDSRCWWPAERRRTTGERTWSENDLETRCADLLAWQRQQRLQRQQRNLYLANRLPRQPHADNLTEVSRRKSTLRSERNEEHDKLNWDEMNWTIVLYSPGTQLNWLCTRLYFSSSVCLLKPVFYLLFIIAKQLFRAKIMRLRIRAEWRRSPAVLIF